MNTPSALSLWQFIDQKAVLKKLCLTDEDTRRHDDPEYLDQVHLPRIRCTTLYMRYTMYIRTTYVQYIMCNVIWCTVKHVRCAKHDIRCAIPDERCAKHDSPFFRLALITYHAMLCFDMNLGITKSIFCWKLIYIRWLYPFGRCPFRIK